MKDGEDARTTADRHALIVQRKLEEKPVSMIAEEVGVSERQVRNVWAAWRDTEKQSMIGDDPLDIVFEHVAGFRVLRQRAWEVFEESAGALIETDGGGKVLVGANPNVRLGSLKLVAELRAKEIALRQETGLLPRDLGQFSVALDVRYIAEGMQQILAKAGVDAAVLAELRQLVRSTLPDAPAELEAADADFTELDEA